HEIVSVIVRERRANQLILSRRFLKCGRIDSYDRQADSLGLNDLNAETFVFTCIYIHVAAKEKSVQFVIIDMREPLHMPGHTKAVCKSEQLFGIATQLFVSTPDNPQSHVVREQADIRIQHTQQVPMSFIRGSSSDKKQFRALSRT